MGYSNTSTTYIVYNLLTNTLMESINIKINDSIIPPALDVDNINLFSPHFKDKVDVSVVSDELSENNIECVSNSEQDSYTMFKDKPKWARSHRDDEIVGHIDKGDRT